MEIPYKIVAAAKSPKFADLVKKENRNIDKWEIEDERRVVRVHFEDYSAEELSDLAGAAERVKNTKVAKVLACVAAARSSDFSKPLPSFEAFESALKDYLAHEICDGWIYEEDKDGCFYPYLVTSIRYQECFRNEDSPRVIVDLVSYRPKENRDSDVSACSTSLTFFPKDVTRRRISDALSAKNLYKETAELKTAYTESIKRYNAEVRDGFSRQFVFDGKCLEDEESRYEGAGKEHRVKVIHDLHKKEMSAKPAGHESILSDDPLPVPEHPLVRVFDLSSHSFKWVNHVFLTEYVYDKSLREKLVLPQSHRDLLDVMTTDLKAFVGDIIEGKSAGNIILAKGIPGVGKTLTAEVYAELIEKPLYIVHSGELGTRADQVQNSLDKIFKLQKRWDCVLLLDEADVFVCQRNNNIDQNAIVAEFLRVLEYFDGLLFMTTNRPDDIDEAIISRCAAVIDYVVPSDADQEKIWRVMLQNYGATLPDKIVKELVRVFHGIAPRDIKMLLRLVLRMAKAKGRPLDVELFRQCAMFRAIKIHG